MDGATITITELTAIEAFKQWGIQRELRGKGIQDTAKKVMKYWVANAFQQIPKGDRAAIRARLMTIVSTYSDLPAATATATTKKAQRIIDRANMYRGTVAARIVATLDPKGVRGKGRAGSPQFYAAVAKYVNLSVFSANLHRAGLLPARKALGVPNSGGPPPKITSAPGSYDEEFLGEDIASIMVENWATSKGGAGITYLAGSAFDVALTETTRRIAEFVHADVLKAAARTGLTAR